MIHGLPKSGSLLFFMTRELRIVFAFKWLEKTNNILWCKHGFYILFTNKVLLGHTYTYVYILYVVLKQQC